MMNTPDGLLLNFQLFPPKGEILRDLLCSIRDRGISRLYIDPGRQFCWNFDTSLKDTGAYPEEFFRGLLAIGESLELTLIPVLSINRIYEFILAHPGTGAAVLPETGPVQLSVIQHLAADMVEDLLSVFAFSPCVALLQCNEEERACRRKLKGHEIMKGMDEAFEQDVVIIEPEKFNSCRVEDLRPGLTGITVLESERFSGFSFPPLPAWLDLLPDDLDAQISAFSTVYARTDALFNDVWRLLRQRWERRVSGFCSVIGKIQEIRSIAPVLKEKSEKLFHSEWFENEQRRWHYALYEASLHQFATQPGSEDDLAAVCALLDPVDGCKR